MLYDALGYDSLTPVQRRKAEASVLVISALWGAIRFGDRVPAYRLSMGTALPDVGRLASFWKPQLNEALLAAAAGELLVDCRSSTYAAAWTPPAPQTVAVNVFTEVDGVRKVVSHFAKHTRGELARHLLTRRGKAPATPAQLQKAAAEKWTVGARRGHGPEAAHPQHHPAQLTRSCCRFERSNGSRCESVGGLGTAARPTRRSGPGCSRNPGRTRCRPRPLP